MKGIILAAGTGTRLYPPSVPISKILLPVYDKPMIYYPFSTLMLAGIKDILIITNENDYDNLKKTLGDGSQYGINIQYEIQYLQRGIADAFLIGEQFVNNDDVVLILGDNIFDGFGFSTFIKNTIKHNVGATIFGYSVNDPERLGVVEFDKNKKAVLLEEKLLHPKSKYAVTGLYFYDNNVCKYTKKLTPSSGGEPEITDLNKIYIENNRLNVEILGSGFTLLDTGTHDSMLQANNFIQSIELNKGDKIACLEEMAINKNFISIDNLETKLPINHYEICVFNDKHCIDLLNKAYFKDKDIIDAGAFIGDSAIVFSDYTARNVHSFEPTSRNFQLLQQTIKLNNKDNIVVVNSALGEVNGDVELFANDSASGILDVKDVSTKEMCKVTTLDDYVRENNLTVGLIKTDLEGAEQLFLKGAENTIKEQWPTMLISIYHTASDFFDIKPMIESWNLNYSFKIVKPLDGQILLETM